MKHLRIGTDRIITWHITNADEPYDLTGKDISLKVSAPGCSFMVTEGFVIDGNVLKWVFRGKDQKTLGPHSLTLIENNGKDGMISFDHCDAFSLVACSCQEGGSDDAGLSISETEISSDLATMGIRFVAPEIGPNMNWWFGGHDSGQSSVPPPLKITHNELVSLRNYGRLTPGLFYRITDYITTTAQTDTLSAGHPFDVIVIALSEYELSEQAWAIQSERDTDGYFSHSNLSAWSIWYCLDNDTERFAWADEERGKGVIYRMIDEWNNDCPYDFKNILFVRYQLDVPESEELDYKWSNQLLSNIIDSFYAGELPYIWAGTNQSYRDWEDYNEEVVSYPTGTTKAFFTFTYLSSENLEDLSLGGTCSNNKIEHPKNKRLSNNIFIGYSHLSDIHYNFIGGECNHNTFGSSCYYNTLKLVCYHNVFANNCQRNTLMNTSNCYLRYGCFTNTFEFGCSNISFGRQCSMNTLKPYCGPISFGNSCSNNTIGAECSEICFGEYYQRNTFDDWCYEVNLENDETASYSYQVQNYHVVKGVKQISIGVYRGLDYETTVANNTEGRVKRFCIADFVTDILVNLDVSGTTTLADAGMSTPQEYYALISGNANLYIRGKSYNPYNVTRDDGNNPYYKITSSGKTTLWVDAELYYDDFYDTNISDNKEALDDYH